MRCLYIKAIDNLENIEARYVEHKVLDFASDKMGRLLEEIADSYYETRGWRALQTIHSLPVYEWILLVLFSISFVYFETIF